MPDCPNTEIRDLLPEHVHSLLSEADTLSVEQHVLSCETCSHELTVLRAALSVRPTVAPVNIMAIVAQLPRPGHKSALLHRNISVQRHEDDHGVRALTSAPSVVRKSMRSRTFNTWRLAAVLTLVVAGGLSVVIARQGIQGISSQPSISDSAHSQLVNKTNSVLPQMASITPASRVALSVGELSEYSDAELESVIRNLEKWDGTAGVEPLPGIPLVPSTSGTSR